MVSDDADDFKQNNVIVIYKITVINKIGRWKCTLNIIYNARMLGTLIWIESTGVVGIGQLDNEKIIKNSKV